LTASSGRRALTLRRQCVVLDLVDLGAHDHPAPDIDDDVQLQEAAADGGRQERDVPRPHLVGPLGNELSRSSMPTSPCSTSLAQQLHRSGDPVEGALRGKVDLSVANEGPRDGGVSRSYAA